MGKVGIVFWSEMGISTVFQVTHTVHWPDRHEVTPKRGARYWQLITDPYLLCQQPAPALMQVLPARYEGWHTIGCEMAPCLLQPLSEIQEIMSYLR